MHTTVVNVRNVSLSDQSVIYCGRPGKGQAGPFGNPFITGRDGTREQVIAKHAAWFASQHELQGDLVRAVERKHKSGIQVVRLACFCHPLACHCDCMSQFVNNLE